MTEDIYYRNDKTGSIMCPRCWGSVPPFGVYSPWRTVTIDRDAPRCTVCKQPIKARRMVLPAAQEG